ncbi:MAG: helix-turn-helix domain-containing protein [Clostridiales bacterium]|nr:helix-turn-helix domain-containing protein [Clostridiales bacterium]
MYTRVNKKSTKEVDKLNLIGYNVAIEGSNVSIMLTSVGKFLRKLRIDNGEILKDMAETLGVSSAFLSAVENGKKKMPESWMEKIAEIYSFTDVQANEFYEAVIDTNNAIELNLQNATPNNKMLAISFAREFDSLDDETSKKIFEILKRHKED